MNENEIEKLPRDIWESPSLKTLDVSHNQLMFLPRISNMTRVLKIKLKADHNPWNFQEFLQKENLQLSESFPVSTPFLFLIMESQLVFQNQTQATLKELAARTIIYQQTPLNSLQRRLPLEVWEYLTTSHPCENVTFLESLYLTSFVILFLFLIPLFSF